MFRATADGMMPGRPRLYDQFEADAAAGPDDGNAHRLDAWIRLNQLGQISRSTPFAGELYQIERALRGFLRRVRSSWRAWIGDRLRRAREETEIAKPAQDSSASTGLSGNRRQIDHDLASRSLHQRGRDGRRRAPRS